jgi:hypothetical protein
MESYRNVAFWHANIIRICGPIPVVLCGNKIENSGSRKVMQSDIKFHKEHRLQYYEVSAVASYNFDKPFFKLSQILSNQADLYFLEKSILKPPEIIYEPKEGHLDGDGSIAGGDSSSLSMSMSAVSNTKTNADSSSTSFSNSKPVLTSRPLGEGGGGRGDSGDDDADDQGSVGQAGSIISEYTDND